MRTAITGWLAKDWFKAGAARARAGAVACGTLAVLAGTLAYVPAADATVYKWRDTRGMVHYTDRPPPPDGTLISIETTYFGRRTGDAARAPAPRAPATPAAPSAPEPDRLSPNAQAQLRNQVQNDLANVRTEQCKEAQERYDNYIRSRRLFREGPNKERIYLTDGELEAARLNAKREVDEACAAAAEGR
ncbi:MAG: DUF4124 domain-containing protein [Steroidobacteraceae bacterium]|nr:DUF4124 domain-containing protein [Steroidobacteraceae bacterium]